MTKWMGMRMHGSREREYVGIMQCSLSCDGSSYCIVQEENSCTDSLLQLQNFSMVRWSCGQFTEGRTNVHNEDHNGQPSLVMPKVCSKQFCRTDASQFCRTDASQFWNTLVSSPRCLAQLCTKSSPGGRRMLSQRQR